MAADELDRIESELVANFKQLGLNKYEAQTLINLYRLGTGTAKDIARVNNVPRTRVYDAAESLHELGLVDIQYSTPRSSLPSPSRPSSGSSTSTARTRSSRSRTS